MILHDSAQRLTATDGHCTERLTDSHRVKQRKLAMAPVMDTYMSGVSGGTYTYGQIMLCFLGIGCEHSQSVSMEDCRPVNWPAGGQHQLRAIVAMIGDDDDGNGERQLHDICMLQSTVILLFLTARRAEAEQ